MEYIYAALLLHSVKKEINEENLKKVLEATGAKIDDNKLKATIAALDGVNIDEAISKAAMPVATAAPKAQEEKKEEKEEDNEKKAEEAAAGLGSLFG